MSKLIFMRKFLFGIFLLLSVTLNLIGFKWYILWENRKRALNPNITDRQLGISTIYHRFDTTVYLSLTNKNDVSAVYNRGSKEVGDCLVINDGNGFVYHSALPLDDSGMTVLVQTDELNRVRKMALKYNEITYLDGGGNGRFIVNKKGR